MKSPLKRIIGFQYCPSDPKKLMVTSGDSQVRILDGIHVISNYKGLRNSSQVAASFTPDGQMEITLSLLGMTPVSICGTMQTNFLQWNRRLGWPHQVIPELWLASASLTWYKTCRFSPLLDEWIP